MRITNKMMTNNMMSNINKNKTSLNFLEQQYASGKKIQRPSDDPIITVRALKLRTNLSELTQYYEKNIPDAMSWMDVTEGSLTTINGLLSKINTSCIQGSSDPLTAEDRNSIVQNLKEMRQQILHEGNTNYAGRYVFTGYKTDSPLIFGKDTNHLVYNITESFSGNQIQYKSKTIGEYSLADFEDNSIDFNNPPQIINTYRLQLSYDNLDSIPIESISYFKPSAGGALLEQTPFTNINQVSVLDPDAYTPIPGSINFIPETGELIFASDVYEEFRTAQNMQFTYSKSSFSEGNLMPEHYFNCVVTDTSKPELEPITYTKTKQSIQYEINYNQKLTINTEGSDAISHSIGRAIDDILNSVNDVIATEGKIEEVKKRLSNNNLSDEDRQRYEKMLEHLDTELVLKKTIMRNSFEKGITASQKEQDKVNIAVSDLGSRYVRLKLTENRLSSQQVDFEELMSKNEDADVVDTFIKLTAAETIYTASLSAAAKVVRNTLLDFL